MIVKKLRSSLPLAFAASAALFVLVTTLQASLIPSYQEQPPKEHLPPSKKEADKWNVSPVIHKKKAKRPQKEGLTYRSPKEDITKRKPANESPKGHLPLSNLKRNPKNDLKKKEANISPKEDKKKHLQKKKPPSTSNNPLEDKEKVMDMLRAMQVDPYSIDNATWAKVPTWTHIQQVWGKEPKIWGLEKACAKFRQDITDAKKRRIAIAGLFSTGTNLMAQLLQHNCAIPERIKWIGRQKGHGMEWQVPWGKHNPFRYHGKHEVNMFKDDKRHPKMEEYFPAVTLRDPYSWMTSMCRNAYTAKWKHDNAHCPNFVDRRTGKMNKVSVKFGAEKSGNLVPFDSLAHMWNVWNGEYFNETKLPLLMLRFEDIIFYPKEVTTQVCECAGGQIMKPLKVYSDKDHSAGDFHYVVGSAINGPGHGKAEGKTNGLVDAWIKYSRPHKERVAKWSKADLQFAQQFLDKRITTFFGYGP